MRTFIPALMLFFSVTVLACGSIYKINSERPASPDLKKYKNVYIGWLDLNEANWKNLGFESYRHWADAIRDLNINSLQSYCRDNLSGRKVTGSRGKGADAAAKGSLYVKMNLQRHEVMSGLNRMQYLHMNIAFIDTATGAARYTASLVVNSSGFGFGNYTLEGQLNFAMRNLANFISSKF